LDIFFSWLDIQSLGRSALVCQRWNVVISSNAELWIHHKQFLLEKKGVLLLPSSIPLTGDTEKRALEKLFIDEENELRESDKENPNALEDKLQELKERKKKRENKKRKESDRTFLGGWKWKEEKQEMRDIALAKPSYAEDIVILIMGILCYFVLFLFYSILFFAIFCYFVLFLCLCYFILFSFIVYFYFYVILVSFILFYFYVILCYPILFNAILCYFYLFLSIFYLVSQGKIAPLGQP
jgi:hypothetical protein